MTRTPSTRRLLDGVAVRFSDRATRLAGPRRRREMTLRRIVYPTHWSIAHRWLVQRPGLDLDAVDADGCTPIWAAAYNGECAPASLTSAVASQTKKMRINSEV